MRTFKSILALVAILVLVAAPASAGGFEDATREHVRSNRSNQSIAMRAGTCADCIPPQVDALILRPAALIGTAVSIAIFLATVPFVAFGDVKSVPAYFDATAGEGLRYVFVDPLGTH